MRYLDTIEAVKRAAGAEEAAGGAQQQSDREESTNKLAEAIRAAEAAQDAAFQAIETFAAVAKNQADRGAVATMGEYVFRPLQRKVEELRAAYGKVAGRAG